MNYEKDIIIDETALDIEWLDQPKLMLKYTRHAAQTRQDMDLAKEEVDLVKAELDKEIRDDPEKFDITTKVTEAVVSNTILACDEYKKVIKKYNKAKFEYEVAQGAVRAFDQRKSALENLVRLHGQQYFAGPAIPRDLSDERQKKEREHETNQKIGKTLRRRSIKND